MKKIYEVAKLSGLSRRTLQYYDDNGFLKVKRSSENYRLYTEADVEVLWQILLYKEMGFRLEETKTLLAADEKHKTETLKHRITEIENEIAKLSKIKAFACKVSEYGLPEWSKESSETLLEQARKLTENI